jgi:hypothetical protein
MRRFLTIVAFAALAACGSGTPSKEITVDGQSFSPAAESSTNDYSGSLFHSALLEILDDPSYTCPGQGLGDAGQTILIELQVKADAGPGSFGYGPPTEPGQFIIEPGFSQEPAYANLTYQTGTAACCEGAKTYVATSGMVTVTSIGPSGITGSFSATAVRCSDLDGGTITLNGNFATTSCSDFIIAQCQTCGC